ncbi:YbfB/YjiJ family MFS transporter [Thauera butanivorans]|uniref:YbfB/YjiJ family MFS transporter n=1 Tax=Thauera butanivorans TaxID=86174 RepID=UPI003AB63020
MTKSGMVCPKWIFHCHFRQLDIRSKPSRLGSATPAAGRPSITTGRECDMRHSPKCTTTAMPNAASLWPAFGLGLAIAVGNGLARFSYALLLPAMREDLAWTYAQAGWLNTANALGYILGAASGYFLLRHASPARLFSWGLWLTLAALPLTGLHGSLASLTAARAAAGIGAAWVFSCGTALIAARYPETDGRRGTAMGVFFAGAGLGIGLSGLVVNPLLAWSGSQGWPAAWLWLGALALLLSVWPLKEALKVQRVSNAPARGALSLRGMRMALLGYFAFAAGYIVYMTFILAWLHTQHGSWQLSTLVWLVLGIGVSLSPFAWRRALEHWPPALTLSASCTATWAGTVIPLLNAHAAGLLASALVFGLGMFIAPSAIAVLVRQKLPAPQLAKGMTLFTVVFSVGQAIGPVAAGWIADEQTLRQSLLFGSGLLLAGTLLPLLGLDRKFDSPGGQG